MNAPLPLRDDDLIIAPSLLSADFTRLGEEAEAVLHAGADWLHVDVMDGHFVPNLTLGPPILAALRKRLPQATLDVHLMIQEPIRSLHAYAEAGADILTVHVEAATHLHRTLQAIRDAGVRVGVTLNPATSLHTLDYVLDLVDLVLVMSVNPGFGGQAFIPSAVHKIAALRQRIQERGLQIAIEVDGGVSPDTIAPCVQAGARAFVAGSAIFKHARYDLAIQHLRSAART